MKEIFSGISKCIFGAGLIGAALLIWANYDRVNIFLDGLKPEEYRNSKIIEQEEGPAIQDNDRIENSDISLSDEKTLIIDVDNISNNIDTDVAAINEDYDGTEAVNEFNDNTTDISAGGNWAEAAELVKPAVCRIKVGNYWGSGVIWDIENNHVYVMANKHVLEKSNIGYAAFYNGMNAAGIVKTISAQCDIGILDVDISTWSNYEKEKIKRVNISDECLGNLEEGTNIFILGSADGVASNVSSGRIADPWFYYEYMDATYIYVYCKAKPGMSGGGCFDTHGHLLGIISGGNEETEETLCIPTQILKEFSAQAN